MASGQDPVGSQHNEWINKRRQIQQDYATQSAEAETKYQQNIAQLHREIEDEFNNFRRTLDELFQSHMREKQGLLDERRRIRQDIFQRAYDQDTKRLKDKFDQDLSKHDMEYYKYFQKSGTTASPGPASAAPPAPPVHVPSPVPMKPPMQAPPLVQQPRPILESQHRQIQPQPPSQPLRAPLQPPQQPPQQPLQQPPPHLGQHLPQLAHPRPQAPLVPLPSQHPPPPPPPPQQQQQQQQQPPHQQQHQQQPQQPPQQQQQQQQQPPQQQQHQQQPPQQPPQQQQPQPQQQQQHIQPHQHVQQIQPAQPVQPPPRVGSSFGPGPINRAGPPVDVTMAEGRPFVPAPVDAAAMAAAQSESELQNARPRSRRGRPPVSGFSAVNAGVSDDDESSRGRSRAQSRPDTVRDKSTTKRRARSVATPNRAKRTRTSPAPGAPSDGEEHPHSVRGLSSENIGQRTATFDEIYQGGHAVYKHLIVDYPPGSEKWYIIRCDEHGVHFNNTNPIAGAAKHLNGKDHNHMSKDRAQAVDLLGIRIVDCTREKAALNNNMVNAAFANGYKPFTHKDRHTRLAFNPDGSPKTDAQKAEAFAQAKAARAIASSMRHSLGGIPPRPVKPIIPEPKGVVSAVPGEIYYGYWTKNQTKYAVVVCGWDDQKCIGHSGRMLGELWPKLLKGAPRCYTVDLNRGIITGWAPGYEDGGIYQHKRHYAVQFFDQSRGVAWLQCRYLSEFRMDDPDRPDNPDDAYNQAREFYAKLRGFKDFEEWRAAGAVHGPVSNDAVESLGSESRYDTPGENPGGPGVQDHGGDDDEDMSYGFAHPHEDDEYDPEQTESEEDVDMEDAPELDESMHHGQDSSRRQSMVGLQHAGESTNSPDVRKSASHEPREGGTLSPLAPASTAVTNTAPTEANPSASVGGSVGGLFQRVKNVLAPPNTPSPSSQKSPADMASSALKQITTSGAKAGEQQNGPAAGPKSSASPDTASLPTAPGTNGTPAARPEAGQNGSISSVTKMNGSSGVAMESGETQTRNSVSQVSLNGSGNATPIINARSLNGTPASSVAGTPTPTPAQNPADRWKAVSTRPVAPALGQTGQKAQTPTASTPASPTALVKQEPNVGTAEPWFDLAGYSGQNGEYSSADHGGKFLRLRLNDGNGRGETDEEEPVQVKIDPLLIVKATVNNETEQSTVSMYGNNNKLQHSVTFVANKDASGRLVVAKIHARKFIRWLRTRNPQVQYTG